MSGQIQKPDLKSAHLDERKRHDKDTLLTNLWTYYACQPCQRSVTDRSLRILGACLRARIQAWALFTHGGRIPLQFQLKHRLPYGETTCFFSRPIISQTQLGFSDQISLAPSSHNNFNPAQSKSFKWNNDVIERNGFYPSNTVEYWI